MIPRQDRVTVQVILGSLLASFLAFLLMQAARADQVKTCDTEDHPTNVPCLWTGGPNGEGSWYYVDEHGLHWPVPAER